MAAEGRENEVAEKPVREQLKNATIGGKDQAALEAGKDTEMAKSHDELPQSSDQAAANDRPKIQKKRSFEEVEDVAQSGVSRHHSRKRSREGTAEDDKINGNGNKRVISGEHARSDNSTSDSGSVNGKAGPVAGERAGTPEPAGEKRSEDAVEAMTSPKTKRSRLHSTIGEEKLADAANVSEEDAKDKNEATKPAENTAAVTSENKILSSSGFGNTSAVSPFGGLAGNKSPASNSETQQTSSSAFAASGFGALAGSTTSGFGAIGKNGGGFGAGGGFGSGSKSAMTTDAKKEDSKPTGSAFGGALGATSAFGGAAASTGGFGSGSSGFGSGASGFGSGMGGSGFGTLRGAGGLSSFASGKSTPQTSTAKTASSFGAPADKDEEGGGGEDDDEEEGGAGIKSPLAVEEDAKDERFYEQDIETGEEDETTQYSARAKLYNYVTLDDGKKEWRERGLGILRLNVKADFGAEDQAPKARFLMRADGSHRVVLNTPIKKEITVGKPPNGGPPTNGFLYFMGTIGESSGLELLQLKMRQQFALDVYEKVKDLQSEM